MGKLVPWVLARERRVCFDVEEREVRCGYECCRLKVRCSEIGWTVDCLSDLIRWGI